MTWSDGGLVVAFGTVRVPDVPNNSRVYAEMLRQCVTMFLRHSRRLVGRREGYSFDAHCCHMCTAIKHYVPDRDKPSFVFF